MIRHSVFILYGLFTYLDTKVERPFGGGPFWG